MPKNNGLNKAKSAKNDEFYTTYDAIQSELNYYEDKFAGKTVFCNCDDPFESNFAKFFLRNFNYLKLKRLICTSYAGSPVTGKQLSLFDDYNEPVSSQHGYVLDITNVPMSNGRGVSDADIATLLHQKGIVKRLSGDGDFRSKESIKYLKIADVVVTNPPFSLFRKYIAQLDQYNKQFIVIGNKNAITYKEIFPLIKDNKLWLGVSQPKEFDTPNGMTKKVNGLTRWFTNVDYKQHHDDLILYKKYNSVDYPHYDNYAAINVGKTADIPMDYFGVMGVPITFLDKFNPDQFEIIGADFDLAKAIIINGKVKPNPQRFYINGKRKYSRILIKNKHPEDYQNK